jgi:glycosyltransferase involved in cell wall biosynthesis
VDVVPYGVDPSFMPRERLPAACAGTLAALGVGEPFALYAGRLNARKNVAALVRAMAYVPDAQVSLVVAGAADGTGDDLRAVAAAAGVAGRVRLLGPVSEEQLRVLYASAAVFCFPSLDEGFGLCPLEAMACGTPTVVSRTPALAEVCGDAAVYVDPRSPEEIGAAIAALVASPGDRAALREAGLRRAAVFDWGRSARALLASARAAAGGRAV